MPEPTQEELELQQGREDVRRLMEGLANNKERAEQSEQPQTQKTKTYVLVGVDENGAFADEVAAWKERAEKVGDVELIYPKEGQTLKDAFAHIKEPANFVLSAHGNEDGTFEWGKEEPVLYATLFDDLPRNAESVTVNSCYGGTSTAAEMLEHAPPGTIVQSQVGSKVMGWDDKGQYAAEVSSQEKITPVTLLLEALDQVNPQDLSQKIKEDNKETGKHNNTNPNDVLPHIIGMGGRPPIRIDLNAKITELSAQAKGEKFNQKAFDDAVTATFNHFDPGSFDLGVDKSTATEKVLYEKLDTKINAVANKILKGEALVDLDEKRIAYAITAANMNTSGEMDKLKEQARQQTAEQTKAPEQEEKSTAQKDAPEKPAQQQQSAKEETEEEKRKTSVAQTTTPQAPAPDQTKTVEVSTQTRVTNIAQSNSQDAPSQSIPAPTGDRLTDAGNLLKSYDLNKDGTVTVGEFQQSGGAAKIGNKLDLNGDGITDKSEIAAALKSSGLSFDKVSLHDAIKNLGGALAQSGVKVDMHNASMPSNNPNAHLAHNVAKGKGNQI